MTTTKLDNYINKIYDEKILKLEKLNNKFEREYFSNNFFRIPDGELLDGSCYNENMERYKKYVYNLDEEGLEFIFNTLKNFYFFSSGCDMVFRKKIEADSYHSTPIKEIIYPKMVKEIHKRFFDSDNFFHPDRTGHISYIESVVDDYINVSTFLHYMYANDFNPPKEISKKFPTSFNSIRVKLDGWDLTVGDYVKALINYKCDVMINIFNAVSDVKLRSTMINKVNVLRYEKFCEVKDLYNQGLHVCYFLDHTIFDLIDVYERNKKYYK